MDMQEMMERLLAEIRADRKAYREQLQDRMKTYQEDLKSDQAKMIVAFKKKTDAMIANIKDARKKTTACQEVTRANPEKIEPNSGEEETAVNRHEIPNEEIAVHSLRTCQSERAASQEDAESDPDPGKMQSLEEHLEIPQEEAVVTPVGEPRKRRRVRKRKEGTWGTCESRRKLTIAGKKMTRRAIVAWRKRNVFRKIVTQGNFGPGSKLTAAIIKVTRYAKMAWLKEKFVRKDCTTDKADQETPKRLNDGKRLRKGLVCNNGIRDRGLREQPRGRMRISDQCGGQSPYLMKEKTTTNSIRGYSSGQRSHLGSEGTLNKILYAIFRGKVAKQLVGTSKRLRRMKKWTLWRGRPLRNGRRNCARSKSR
jgi:hypothetical protein